MNHLPYVPDLYRYQRRRTRVVMVGDVAVGGDNPIRVQSMTTTLTKDIEATAAQVERLVAVGCEIVRITTPTPNDARCLGPIRALLAARGVQAPIVADIHFSPAAALVAADYADKVRINPGNYVDSRKFAVREYSDEEYGAELRRVEERFTPLVLKCKERRISMRIGTNHGSLSDRIMNRFGDTPEGMVASALEFVNICEKHDYRDIILSMKASNPKVMIEAYRLLAARMAELGMDYPFHLGVTEAGNAEDGRIKSAVGIGSLLEDGIGDTIRVSLTEEPEAEVPVAFAIAERYTRRGRATVGTMAPGSVLVGAPVRKGQASPAGRQRPEGPGYQRGDREVGVDGEVQPQDVPWDFYHYARRPSREVVLGGVTLGGFSPVAVFTSIDAGAGDALAHILRWASPAGRRQPKPDATIVNLESASDLDALRRIAQRLRKWPQARLELIARCREEEVLIDALPEVAGALVPVSEYLNLERLLGAVQEAGKGLLLETQIVDASARDFAVSLLLDTAERTLDRGITPVLSLAVPERESVHAYRLLTAQAAQRGIDLPISLRVEVSDEPLLPASIPLGSLLCDGIGDAVSLGGLADSSDLSFNILQATGTRIFKTDYVACPSCGRTLFDLQETTERIKRRTSHLVGVKLAIMGCIVNGPGEMADADFGYVGGAPGQVNLYVGKECVEKGVPAEEADDRLVDLIKAHGKWQEDEV